MFCDVNWYWCCFSIISSKIKCTWLSIYKDTWFRKALMSNRIKEKWSRLFGYIVNWILFHCSKLCNRCNGAVHSSSQIMKTDKLECSSPNCSTFVKQLESYIAGNWFIQRRINSQSFKAFYLFSLIIKYCSKLFWQLLTNHYYQV